MIKNVYAVINTDIKNPIENAQITTLSDVFGFAANVLLGVGWAITFIVLGIAIIKYINSQGDPKETHSAQQAILYAFIGAMIMGFITTLLIVGETLIGVKWTGVSNITNFIK